MNPVTKWECGECAELHDYEPDAHQCCRPNVYEVYVCAVCETRHNYIADAEQCCPEMPANAEDAPDPAALEAAGQERLF